MKTLNIVNIPREYVEARETQVIAQGIRDGHNNGGRTYVCCDGYDGDTRELYRIPEVRAFFAKLFLYDPGLMKMISRRHAGMVGISYWINIAFGKFREDGNYRDVTPNDINAITAAFAASKTPQEVRV